MRLLRLAYLADNGVVCDDTHVYADYIEERYGRAVEQPPGDIDGDGYYTLSAGLSYPVAFGGGESEADGPEYFVYSFAYTATCGSGDGLVYSYESADFLPCSGSGDGDGPSSGYRDKGTADHAECSALDPAAYYEQDEEADSRIILQDSEDLWTAS
ncbi:hypothetical protein EBT31_11310 [bacterium]|nr:hypothetical protein [bacterium]